METNKPTFKIEITRGPGEPVQPYDMPRNLRYDGCISMIRTLAKNVYNIDVTGKKPRLDGHYMDAGQGVVRNWEISTAKNYDTTLSFTKDEAKNANFKVVVSFVPDPDYVAPVAQSMIEPQMQP